VFEVVVDRIGGIFGEFEFIENEEGVIERGDEIREYELI